MKRSSQFTIIRQLMIIRFRWIFVVRRQENTWYVQNHYEEAGSKFDTLFSIRESRGDNKLTWTMEILTFSSDKKNAFNGFFFFSTWKSKNWWEEIMEKNKSKNPSMPEIFDRLFHGRRICSMFDVVAIVWLYTYT